MMIQISVSRLRTLLGPVTASQAAQAEPGSERPSLSLSLLPSLRPAFSGDPSSLHHGQGIR